MTRAQVPSHRPVWLIVLGGIMLLSAGGSLVQSLMKLRDPTFALDGDPGAAASSDDDLTLARQLKAARTAAVDARRGAVRTEAVAQLVLAAFTLYAAAAVLSRDRHGRTLVLAVALLGIAFQIGRLPIVLSLVLDYARSASALARVVLRAAADAKTIPDESTLRSLLVAQAVIGVGGSLVLLAFFGGRRGRALYGVERAAPGARHAHHAGKEP